MNKKLSNVLQALSSIDNQEDLNVIAQAWKNQMNIIAKSRKRTVAKGMTIEWSYRGLTKQGTVTKVNRTTVDVVATGATPFGKTVTRVPMSMITAV
jgi:hypothetical protein